MISLRNLFISGGFNWNVAPYEFDLGICESALLHDLGGSQLIPVVFKVSNVLSVQVLRVWSTCSSQTRKTVSQYLRTMIETELPNFVRYVASSMAESPPPMTANGLFRKIGAAPSQTAHAEIPCARVYMRVFRPNDVYPVNWAVILHPDRTLFQYPFSPSWEPGKSRRLATAPVEMITVSAVTSRSSVQRVNGRLERSTCASNLPGSNPHHVLPHALAEETNTAITTGTAYGPW